MTLSQGSALEPGKLFRHKAVRPGPAIDIIAIQRKHPQFIREQHVLTTMQPQSRSA
ncbi:hypothetical protein [Acetobacter fallax]|uniref:Uncharacterized protein n=1 Tax=Acetobacter fallax TaxID=1737473 RepID=A0ABX0K4T9_9PROT|nr:hypothetical protein [Acetobacter fallax]NHO31389.1 hypothetical protein [Acetobacter fallax]NHO35029.1 hypothetical protein [Acetobacter fallax]